ncbi:MAG: MopE-related protein [Myxococcaceae bacterium]|nr:MopE-related protein [Myxococcaceae bacterium]
MRRLALAAWLSSSACFVPTLEALEQERPRTCDDASPCVEGYICAAGVCRKADGPSCTPGEMRACGFSTGLCRPGVERCTDEGVFSPCTGAVGPVLEVCDGEDNDCDGAVDEEVTTSSCGISQGVCAGRDRACVAGRPEAVCTAASFGPDYEATETTCDAKDNDCDGAVDEGLTAVPCPRSAGPCAGATRSCQAGALTVCTDATYRAVFPDFEAVETECDGRDNDCDGLTDAWAAEQVSDGGTLVERGAVAVALPNTGTLQRRDVLVMAESGVRLVSRTLTSTGLVSPGRAPAVSIAAAERAYGPALASLGSQVAQAWFENQAGAPARTRLALALAGPNGDAIANGGAGISPVTMTGPGQKVALGLTSTRLVVAFAQADSATSANTSVVALSCPRQLDTLCDTQLLGAGRNPALLVDSDAALVVYEVGGRLRAVRLSVPQSGGLAVGPTAMFGGSNERDVALAGTLEGLTVYSIVPGTPDTLWRRQGACTAGGCDAATFTATPAWVRLGGPATGLAVASDGSRRVLAWAETRAGVSTVRALDALGSMPTPFDVAAPARRPVPVLAGRAGVYVFYDTEGATSGVADVVLQRRFCEP